MVTNGVALQPVTKEDEYVVQLDVVPTATEPHDTQ